MKNINLMLLLLAPMLFSQTILKGPYLQTVDTTSLKIFWESSTSSTGVVFFGLASSNEDSVSEQQASTLHKIKITGLSKNTTYKYYVSSGGVSSSEYTF